MFEIQDKGSKLRAIPAHPEALESIDDYVDLDHAGHREDGDSPLFRPVKNYATG